MVGAEYFNDLFRVALHILEDIGFPVENYNACCVFLPRPFPPKYTQDKQQNKQANSLTEYLEPKSVDQQVKEMLLKNAYPFLRGPSENGR